MCLFVSIHGFIQNNNILYEKLLDDIDCPIKIQSQQAIKYVLTLHRYFWMFQHHTWIAFLFDNKQVNCLKTWASSS